METAIYNFTETTQTIRIKNKKQDAWKLLLISTSSTVFCAIVVRATTNVNYIKNKRLYSTAL